MLVDTHLISLWGDACILLAYAYDTLSHREVGEVGDQKEKNRGPGILGTGQGAEGE